MTLTGLSSTPAVSPRSELVISAKGVSKRFDNHQAISDVSLDIERGRVFGLLGPNGAGKTTTVRLLNHVLTPDSGEIWLFGERLTAATADEVRSRIGVQTDTNIYESLTARENLHFWAELYGVPKQRRRARVDELLEIMELTDRATSLAGTFSKGMRQKLGVARAVVHRPELLFLDEPTTGLDPEASLKLIDFLRGMIATDHTTMVMCTHQLDGLETLCTDVGVLIDGRMAASGPMESLVSERWPGHWVTLELANSSLANLESAHRVLADQFPEANASITDAAALLVSMPQAEMTERLVATLVHHEFAIRALVPVQRSIRDVYFDVIGSARGGAV